MRKRGIALVDAAADHGRHGPHLLPGVTGHVEQEIVVGQLGPGRRVRGPVGAGMHAEGQVVGLDGGVHRVEVRVIGQLAGQGHAGGDADAPRLAPDPVDLGDRQVGVPVGHEGDGEEVVAPGRAELADPAVVGPAQGRLEGGFVDRHHAGRRGREPHGLVDAEPVEVLAGHGGVVPAAFVDLGVELGHLADADDGRDPGCRRRRGCRGAGGRFARSLGPARCRAARRPTDVRPRSCGASTRPGARPARGTVHRRRAGASTRCRGHGRRHRRREIQLCSWQTTSGSCLVCVLAIPPAGRRRR